MATIVQVLHAFRAVLVATRPPETSANALSAMPAPSPPSPPLPHSLHAPIAMSGTLLPPRDSSSVSRAPLDTTPLFWVAWIAIRVGLGRTHSAGPLRARGAVLGRCPPPSPPSHHRCAPPVLWAPGHRATPRDAKSAARARTGTTHGSSPSSSTLWCLYSTAQIRAFDSQCTL